MRGHIFGGRRVARLSIQLGGTTAVTIAKIKKCRGSSLRAGRHYIARPALTCGGILIGGAVHGPKTKHDG